MKYELLYVLSAHYTDAELPQAQGKVSAALAGIGAQISRHNHAGKLKIAYPIKKTRYGHYFLAAFDAETARMKELTNRLRLTPEVIRFQVVRPETGAPTHQTLLSHEDAVSRARALRETIRSVAPAVPSFARLPIASAPTAPRVQLSEEEIEQKIEKLLSEEEEIK